MIVNKYPAVSTILTAAQSLFDTDDDGWCDLSDVNPEYTRAVVELVTRLVWQGDDGRDEVAATLGLEVNS